MGAVMEELFVIAYILGSLSTLLVTTWVGSKPNVKDPLYFTHPDTQKALAFQAQRQIDKALAHAKDPSCFTFTIDPDTYYIWSIHHQEEWTKRGWNIHIHKYIEPFQVTFTHPSKDLIPVP